MSYITCRRTPPPPGSIEVTPLSGRAHADSRVERHTEHGGTGYSYSNKTLFFFFARMPTLHDPPKSNTERVPSLPEPSGFVDDHRQNGLDDGLRGDTRLRARTIYNTGTGTTLNLLTLTFLLQYNTFRYETHDHGLRKWTTQNLNITHIPQNLICSPENGRR